MLAHIPVAPQDSIFGLVQKYNEDTSPKKVNVVVGAYRTEEGEPYLFEVVRKAEKLLVAHEERNKEYLPIAGFSFNFSLTLTHSTLR